MINLDQKIKSIREKEHGQIIVIMALAFIGLVAIVGLAVDLGFVFVSYSRLRRAVDAAALSASSQFREGYTQANLELEAQQFLDLNDISDANSLDIRIEACDFAIIANDPELCTTPARKLVRVTVTQNVPLFFLSVVGIREAPITVDAISEAASVDIVLVIDRSVSMAQVTNLAGDTIQVDPAECNIDMDCHPFEEIKAAALLLVDRMFLSPDGIEPGYDRISVVTFDRYPKVELELSDNELDVVSAIENLTVYRGEEQGVPKGRCPWPSQMNAWEWKELVPDSDFFEGPCRLYSAEEYDTDPGAPSLQIKFVTDGAPADKWLRLVPDWDNGNFERMTCQSWEIVQINRDPRGCMVTNSGGGLKVAGNVLGGRYPSGFPFNPTTRPQPPIRETALWVVVWLTDGFSNAGFTNDGADYIQASELSQAYCPGETWTTERKCLDTNAHPTVAEIIANPPPAAFPAYFSNRHRCASPFNTDHPCNPDFSPNTPNPYYDADDYARDMVDFVTNSDTNPDPTKTQYPYFIPGQGAMLFTIGLGDKLDDPPAPPTGETLLIYGAYKGGAIENYYPAPTPADLNGIFLAIANKIATRLSR